MEVELVPLRLTYSYLCSFYWVFNDVFGFNSTNGVLMMLLMICIDNLFGVIILYNIKVKIWSNCVFETCTKI